MNRITAAVVAAVAATALGASPAHAGEPIASLSSIRQVQHRTVQYGDVCFDQRRHRDITRAVWPAEQVSYGTWSRWANWSAAHSCLS